MTEPRDLLAKVTVENNYLTRIDKLETKNDEAQHAELETGAVDRITDDLGTIRTFNLLSGDVSVDTDGTTLSGSGLIHVSPAMSLPSIAGTPTASLMYALNGTVTWYLDDTYGVPHSVFPIGAEAYRSTTQGITGGATAAVIVYDTQISDTGNCFAPSDSKFYAPITGDYDVDASIQSTHSGTSTYTLTIVKQGTISRARVRLTDSGAVQLSLHDCVPLVAGEYIQIYIYSSVNATIAAATTTDLAYNKIMFRRHA
jgi:hypothetical protein